MIKQMFTKSSSEVIMVSQTLASKSNKLILKTKEKDHILPSS